MAYFFFLFVCSLENIESDADCSQSHKKPQHNPEQWVCLDHGPSELEHRGRLGGRRPNLRLVFRRIQHFLQIVKDLDGFGQREKKIPMRSFFFFFFPPLPTRHEPAPT